MDIDSIQVQCYTRGLRERKGFQTRESWRVDESEIASTTSFDALQGRQRRNRDRVVASDSIDAICNSFQPVCALPHSLLSVKIVIVQDDINIQATSTVVCRQAMVFPNPHRPTGSGTRRNIAPGHRPTELAKNYKMGAPLLLADLSTGRTPLRRRFPFLRRVVAAHRPSSTRRHVGSTGPRSDRRRRRNARCWRRNYFGSDAKNR